MHMAVNGHALPVYKKNRIASLLSSLKLLYLSVLFDFINLTQVHNFTVSAQDILPSVDFRYLP